MLEMTITLQPSNAIVGYRGGERGMEEREGRVGGRKGRRAAGEGNRGRRGGNLEQGRRLAKAGPARG